MLRARRVWPALVAVVWVGGCGSDSTTPVGPPGEAPREVRSEATAWLNGAVLWAHNYHVSTQPGAQGAWLRAIFGNDTVVFGFSHESGTFTAVTTEGGQPTTLAQHNLDPVPLGSYESYFATVDAPSFFLDLRDRRLSPPASSSLAGPLRFRSIGCCYDPSHAESYWTTTSLSTTFDVMIHVRRTRATTLLPTLYPTGF